MYIKLMKGLKNQILSSKLGKIALAIIFIFTIISIFAFLSPYDPNGIDMASRFTSPNLKNIFGTDIMGRDYFTRILYGGRISLSVGFLSMLISITIGTIVGSISGYFEGKLDSFLMRVVDILMSIPSFFIILILNAYLKPSMGIIVAVIGLLGWMTTARLVRAETLSIKSNEYVLYAKSLGISNFKIITKHIIPNVLPTIIVAATLSIASAILIESSLSFLGMGVQAPDASWGSMLSKSQGYMDEAAYLGIFPGVFILITVLSFNILGDTIRNTLDKRGE
ncbi:MAG: ABC transporter permease [Senegalia sp. (in: firmicutes)]|uniref:ABC transporter permease n=1 Tax=Senegalia sp. (in: firmicutes) TaxID=1924098 RepID=UPI003F99E579